VDPYETYMLSQGLSGFNMLAGSIGQAVGYFAFGDASAALGRMNQSLLELQARDAIQRGELESYRVLHMAREMVGKQRVGYAKGGVRVDTGSAAQVQEATATLGALDAATIQSNAIREAFGFKVRAIHSRLESRMAQNRALQEGSQSILQGLAGTVSTAARMDRVSNLYGGTKGESAGIVGKVSEGARGFIPRFF
jgi:hypothetical protein